MRAALGLLAASVLTAFFTSRDVRACSCGGPPWLLVSPWRSDTAPLNAHVLIEAPTAELDTRLLVLRPHGATTAVAVQLRTYPDALVTYVELIPTAPLAPATRFEVAAVDPTAHPPVTVIGTFKTATSMDLSPPQLDGIGRRATHINPQANGAACEVQGPWIELSQLAVHDDWPNAELLYGVWWADARGNVTTQRVPDTIVFPDRGVITLGRASLCSVARYPLKGPIVTFAIAAMDEAGNISRPIHVSVDVTRASP